MFTVPIWLLPFWAFIVLFAWLTAFIVIVTITVIVAVVTGGVAVGHKIYEEIRGPGE